MGCVITLIAGGIFDRIVPALFVPPFVAGTAVLVTGPLSRAWRAAIVAATTAASAVAVARSPTVARAMRSPR